MELSQCDVITISMVSYEPQFKLKTFPHAPSLHPPPPAPPPFPWTQKETSPSPDSAFSQSVKLLPRRVGDFMVVPAAPLLVAPSGAARSRWTSVSKRSQSLPANPTHLFLQQFNCDVIGWCLPLHNTTLKKSVFNDLIRD